MRALERNKQKIYIANYTGRSVITEGGLETGEYELTYSAPAVKMVNISSSKGEASVELFGTDLNYSSVIVTDKDLGIDENSILWVGKEAYSGSVVTPHNYIVSSVSKSLNSFAYAIRKVDVS